MKVVNVKKSFWTFWIHTKKKQSPSTNQDITMITKQTIKLGLRRKLLLQKSLNFFSSDRRELHSQQMLQFRVLTVRFEFVQFHLGWSLWDSFLAHPASVNALLHPSGCRKQPLRYRGWVKRFTQCLGPVLQFSSQMSIWWWWWCVERSHLGPSELCQRRALFEFIPTNITEQFSSLTRGAQGLWVEFNHFCNQKWRTINCEH